VDLACLRGQAQFEEKLATWLQYTRKMWSLGLAGADSIVLQLLEIPIIVCQILRCGCFRRAAPPARRTEAITDIALSLRTSYAEEVSPQA